MRNRERHVKTWRICVACMMLLGLLGGCSKVDNDHIDADSETAYSWYDDSLDIPDTGIVNNLTDDSLKTGEIKIAGDSLVETIGDTDLDISNAKLDSLESIIKETSSDFDEIKDTVIPSKSTRTCYISESNRGGTFVIEVCNQSDNEISLLDGEIRQITFRISDLTDRNINNFKLYGIDLSNSDTLTRKYVYNIFGAPQDYIEGGMNRIVTYITSDGKYEIEFKFNPYEENRKTATGDIDDSEDMRDVIDTVTITRKDIDETKLTYISWDDDHEFTGEINRPGPTGMQDNGADEVLNNILGTSDEEDAGDSEDSEDMVDIGNGDIGSWDEIEQGADLPTEEQQAEAWGYVAENNAVLH